MAPDRGLTDRSASPGLVADSHSLESREAQTENPALPPTLSTSAGNPSLEASIPPHLSHDMTTHARRSDPFQFGQRFLSETDDVFEFNAWDHVEPDDEHEAYCEEQYEKQRSAPVSEFDKQRFNAHPEKWWDLFYKQKSDSFFKDRKWLVQEFPILHDVTRADAGKKVVLEVGAGAGNTAFPILRMNENDELVIHAYDFSKQAVETMRKAPEYDEQHMVAEVWDVAAELPSSIEAGTVDVVIMIFVFSALSPEQWKHTVSNIHRLLKPGGVVLFRDYGRGDLAQVRFKGGRWMQENFYVRGDGTRVYFFTVEELKQIWSGQEYDGASFIISNLDTDRRLIVNRQRRIKMYRCWLQGRFEKPVAN